MADGSKHTRVATLVRKIVAAGAVAAGAFAAAHAQPATRTVLIVNGTRTAMVSLQVRPSQTGPWQADMLDNRSLGIQKQIGIQVPIGGDCFFDLKASFEDGHRVMKRHVNLCRSQTYLLTNF